LIEKSRENETTMDMTRMTNSLRLTGQLTLVIE